MEPTISTQWFVKMKPLAEPALEVVRRGEIEIIPERFTKVYYNWLENIRDWCVSRQLWWGHRIPAWHCNECSQITVARRDPERCAHCGSKGIEQDPDVLDTWFSSGLWPFSTLGWPEQTEDYAYFYPTTMMETGYDILFFWVARMIMLGLEFTGQVPFRKVYLHGLVRDAEGRKMSKSLGNVIDPERLMEQYGTDALRFTLLTGSTPGNDMNLSEERVAANRNFANKIWNAGRLVIGAMADLQPPQEPVPEPTLADRWILSRTGQVIADVERLFANYQYGEAGRQVYEFFWGEYADWYLEIAKLQLRQGGARAWSTAGIMARVLDTCLRLLHPFTPFVTEELWGRLKEACLARPGIYTPPGGWGEALIVARWPEGDEALAQDEQAQEAFTLLMDLVRAIRNVRAERGVQAGRRIAAVIEGGPWTEMLRSQAQAIAALARLDPAGLDIRERLDGTPAARPPLVVGAVQAFLPLQSLVDPERERKRLGAELEQVQARIERLQQLLQGPFAERAPAEVVAKERKKLEKLRQTESKLRQQLEALG